MRMQDEQQQHLRALTTRALSDGENDDVSSDEDPFLRFVGVHPDKNGSRGSRGSHASRGSRGSRGSHNDRSQRDDRSRGVSSWMRASLHVLFEPDCLANLSCAHMRSWGRCR
jgi:hypothetical protein